ncbi:Lrp/AsnC family transcriptional regulator [Sphingomonas sp. ASV193]|uniref:Lrp/AsnC family transcriptional regulator n=1 Tax=Sphingomonas sp. ASV193 TaxID=3144405 RepID=UPI0032E85E33
MAKKVGLSSTPCWRRIARLKSEGTIQKTVAIVDPAAIGRDLTAFVNIETSDHSPDWRHHFIRFLAERMEIMEVHRLAGEVDYLLKVAVADMRDYDVFYRELTRAVPLKNISTTFVMERIKESTLRPARPREDGQIS